MNPANPVSGYFSRIGLNRGRLLTVIVLAATLSGILWAQFRTPVHSPQTTTAVSRPVKLGASPKIENRLNENRVNQSKRSVIAQKIAESQEGFRQEKPNPKQAEATRKNLDSGKLLRPVELGDPVVVSSDPWQEVKLGILEKQDPFALPIGIENLKKANLYQNLAIRHF
ncbi:MAG: hypothetical protein VX438_15650 [Planctomycetota bacterium]|nr:hypothetical protein [Planctomycetota bacterium]